MARPAPITEPWRTSIASHRGGALVWPENSPTAFANTAKLPVEYVEFDVQRSVDGVLAVFHDAMLDRTTNGSGPLADKAWAELRSLVLDGTDDERIPSLDEVIEIFKPTEIILRLELKPGANLTRYQGIEGEILDRLIAHGMVGQTMVTSFLLDTLVDMRAALTDRNLTVGAVDDMVWLVNPTVVRCLGGVRTVFEVARSRSIGAVGLHKDVINDGVVRQARANGLRLGAWAVHEAADIERMFELGVTTFTTDRPDLALDIRDRLRASGAIT